MSVSTLEAGELARALETAEEAARIAGAYLLDKQGHVQVRQKKAAHDALLDADIEAERLVLAHLHDAFPDIGFLSEEAGKIHSPAAYEWVVDPLDGSMNFQHGSPLFGVVIALRAKRKTVLSAIYLPVFDEIYTAIRDQGAHGDGQAIRVSKTADLGDALIYVGDFAKTGNPADNVDRVAIMSSLATKAGRIRMVGSSAVDHAHIASGKADGLIMYSGHAWDEAAGGLLVAEAGGATKRIKASVDTVQIASNSLLIRELTETAFPAHSVTT